MIFDPIRVVTRPKKNGLGTHFGVEFPSGEVYDITITEGTRQISKREFADGEAVVAVKKIPWNQGHIVRARLDELIRNPRKYDLVNWNCETFAEYLTSGQPKSGQVVLVLALIGLALGLALMARS
jgi:hypothetical protein